MHIPIFWKNHSEVTETTADEMRDLMRQIGGKPISGEREPQLMARARRRINTLLPDSLKLTERRARGYWNAEYETVKGEHGAAARDVVSVLPIEEAIDAIEQQIEIHRTKIELLNESRAVLAKSYRGGVGDFAPAFPLAPAQGREGDSDPTPARATGVISSRPHGTLAKALAGT